MFNFFQRLPGIKGHGKCFIILFFFLPFDGKTLLHNFFLVYDPSDKWRFAERVCALKNYYADQKNVLNERMHLWTCYRVVKCDDKISIPVRVSTNFSSFQPCNQNTSQPPTGPLFFSLLFIFVYHRTHVKTNEEINPENVSQLFCLKGCRLRCEVFISHRLLLCSLHKRLSKSATVAPKLISRDGSCCCYVNLIRNSRWAINAMMPDFAFSDDDLICITVDNACNAGGVGRAATCCSRINNKSHFHFVLTASRLSSICRPTKA